MEIVKSNSRPSTALYKEQAKRLREFLLNAGVVLKHANALEAVAKMHGHRDFHALTAAVKADRKSVPLDKDILRTAIAGAISPKWPLPSPDAITWEIWEGLVDEFDQQDQETTPYPLAYQDIAFLARAS